MRLTLVASILGKTSKKWQNNLRYQRYVMWFEGDRVTWDMLWEMWEKRVRDMICVGWEVQSNGTKLKFYKVLLTYLLTYLLSDITESRDAIASKKGDISPLANLFF